MDFGVGRLELPGDIRTGKVLPVGRERPEAIEVEILPDLSPQLSAAETARELRRRRTDLRFGDMAWAALKWVILGSLRFVWCLFGIATMIVLLAFVSAVPVLNFIALGYLLSVEGRVARSGKLRDAFPLVGGVAPWLGLFALTGWMCILPMRLLSEAAADARIIDPGSTADRLLHLLLPVAMLTAIGITLLPIALVCAMYPLGEEQKLHFPPRFSEFWTRAEHAIHDFVRSLRIREYFWLGFRGFAGAFLWLVIPTAFFAAARKTEGGPILITLFGGFLLIVVLSWMPFLQAHFAAENRFSAMFDLRAVRRLYANSPLCWMLTVVLTLALALPLYLSKVVLPPQDAMWMLTLFFIVTIYPVKVLTGWAYHRALTRPRKAFFAWRWLCWLVMFPVIGFYVFLLFFTQFIGEHGKGVLFEHHAFLLPVPF